ncbi:hypothetical protein PA25_24750 [Pseudoalteromonas sp. A25]|uniref:hypothetical protein n=1 Tax=Pseudoalteromonas sp. A25 TaxID=116092 RepID=UPI0012A26C1C|nr:hypothetical protein [Pseudoalteromonas sp. A25]BBN82490.1 hypothetical protein PA25_24750 [Pseudoalteromonas sp. A25]
MPINNAKPAPKAENAPAFPEFSSIEPSKPAAISIAPTNATQLSAKNVRYSSLTIRAL